MTSCSLIEFQHSFGPYHVHMYKVDMFIPSLGWFLILFPHLKDGIVCTLLALQFSTIVLLLVGLPRDTMVPPRGTRALRL
jgi:hypothetical protein